MMKITIIITSIIIIDLMTVRITTLICFTGYYILDNFCDPLIQISHPYYIQGAEKMH